MLLKYKKDKYLEEQQTSFYKYSHNDKWILLADITYIVNRYIINIKKFSKLKKVYKDVLTSYSETYEKKLLA